MYYGFTSFVLPMMAETGWSKPLVMGANALALLVWGLATYLAGAWIDKGHARLLMSSGCAVGAVGFALWAMAKEPWMLYAAHALLGLAAAATLYEPAFNVITRRFPRDYRRGITAVTLVGGLASTLSFPAVAWLIQAFGWRGALWWLAAMLALVLVPLHAWALRGDTGVVEHHGAATEPAVPLSDALRSSAFWLLTASFTAYAVVMAALWAHAVPLMASKGLSEAQALAVLVWVGPAQVAGRWVLARFGSAVSLRRLGIGVLWLMTASMLLLAWAQHPLVLVAWACIYGVANGLVTIVRGALVPEYFGRAHIGRIGGAMSGFSLVLRSVGPVLLAFSLLWLPGYGAGALLLASLGALSALCFMAARPPPRVRSGSSGSSSSAGT